MNGFFLTSHASAVRRILCYGVKPSFRARRYFGRPSSSRFPAETRNGRKWFCAQHLVSLLNVNTLAQRLLLNSRETNRQLRAETRKVRKEF